MMRFNYSNLLPSGLHPVERWIHLVMWLSGLIILNWPGEQFTIGVFSSQDQGLLIPGLYGTLINAAIVYGVGNLIMNYDRQMDFGLFLQTLLIYLTGSGIESFIDAGYFVVLATAISLDVVWEIILGNVIMNFFFFYVPGLIYGIVKSSTKSREPEHQKIAIQDGHNRVLVSADDISHVESDGNYVKFHTSKGVILERASLVSIENRLPPSFIRCHKSFIINQEAIEKITATSVEVGGHTIPVGRKYKGNLT